MGVPAPRSEVTTHCTAQPSFPAVSWTWQKHGAFYKTLQDAAQCDALSWCQQFWNAEKTRAELLPHQPSKESSGPPPVRQAYMGYPQDRAEQGARLPVSCPPWAEGTTWRGEWIVGEGWEVTSSSIPSRLDSKRGLKGPSYLAHGVLQRSRVGSWTPPHPSSLQGVKRPQKKTLNTKVFFLSLVSLKKQTRNKKIIAPAS